MEIEQKKNHSEYRSTVVFA